MLSEPVPVMLPADVPGLTPAVLARVTKTFFSRTGKEVLQQDVGKMTGWPDFVVLRVFLHLERQGLVRVMLGVFHRETGTFIGGYPFSGGRPKLPLEVDDEEGRFTVKSEDELEYEITAVVVKPVALQALVGP